MRILGIETSCDETAAAVVEASGGLSRPQFKILSNVVSSQVKLHAPYGGVVPNLAKREHQKNLVPIMLDALGKAGLLKSNIKYQKSKIQIKNRKILRSAPDLHLILGREPELLRQFKKYIVPLKPLRVDAICVTVGPGLEPALWVGVNFARALAYIWEKPLIPVNHLEGHIYSNWLEPIRVKTNNQLPITKRFVHRKIKFPAICLIVSGGHTELILMQGYGKYRLLGETRDDAAGEAYDKVARLLGLGFPGGPAIDALASKLPITNYQLPIRLPRPMLHSKDYDFSFAGLKTAALYLVRDLKKARKKIPVQKICAEFQSAVIEVLIQKTLRASREHGAKTIMVSGGVAANSALRAEFAKSGALFPPPEFTGDNAAMIAMAGYINHRLGKPSTAQTLAADANLRITE